MKRAMSFGAWLKQRRNALDLTQTDLAERIGCSRDTIQKIEAGTRRPSKQVAGLLAVCLGVAPEQAEPFVRWARLGEGGPDALPQLAPTLGAPPPPATPPRPPPNLPAPLTSLLGREHDVAAVRAYLLRDEVRLLSLVGPPGIGKTRLGIQAAVSLESAFADGTWFVPLETVSDPDRVPAAIAAALGLRPTGQAPVLSALQDALCGKQALLVLDNLEQVLDAGRDIVSLLTACPKLKVLATSREALHTYGEWRYPVPPLALPNRHHLTDPDPSLLAALPSVALFVERAQAVRPDLAFTRENALAIATICLRLDGLPLAIELAAARAELLAPEQILAALDDRFQLLKGTLRYLPHRQQTLRGAVDWSYHLLEAGERALLRRMGTFVGGGSLKAMQAVCGSALDRPAEMQAAARSLVGKSLLREEHGAAGGPRYLMLESIREYAQQKLEASGEADAIRERHARFFAALAEAARPKLVGPEQGQWLRQLEQEHDNIRAALAWSTQSGAGSAEIALRLSGSLGQFWDMHGHAGEGRRWLRAALELGPPAEDSLRAGDEDEAAATTLRLRAYVAAGGLATVQGDHAAAHSAYQEALRLSQQTGDAASTAVCLMNLGNNACHLGEYEQARAFYERALALSREQGDKRRVAVTLLNMGHAAMNTGEYAAARVFLNESLELRRECGDRFGAALVIGNLGVVAAEQGEHEQARALLQESLALRQELGDERGIAFCLTRLAALERDRRRYAEAVELYGRGLALYQKVGDQEAIATGLEGLGEALASLGETARAVRLWARAQAIRRACHAPIPPVYRERHERELDRARATLGEAAFERAWAEGQATSADEASGGVATK